MINPQVVEANTAVGAGCAVCATKNPPVIEDGYTPLVRFVTPLDHTLDLTYDHSYELPSIHYD